MLPTSKMASMDVTDGVSDEGEEFDDDRIPPGTKIAIKGLKAKPELNGQIAIVGSLNEDTGRYNVVIASGETLALKPEALELSLGPAEERTLSAESLLEAGEYAKAVLEAETALDNLPMMARASIARGRALLVPMLVKRDEDGTPLDKDVLEEAARAFNLAGFLDGECEEADDELYRVQQLQKELEASPPATVASSAAAVGGAAVAAADGLDVIIVGAGAAGVGCALMLVETFALDPSRVLLLERGAGVGDTFKRWPAEMRFISPSFNQQGWTSSFDLNSISHGTSLAYSLHSEHPSGVEYAAYLSALAERAKLNVRAHTEVVSVQAEGAKGFSVEVRRSASSPESVTESSPEAPSGGEKLTARYVVWAAGEYQYPREGACKIDGTALCMHNSRVRSWASLPGDEFVLIGGYESGADAAINLAKAGKRSTVLASTAAWNVQTPDPSTELAPYTAARLREVTAPGFATPPKLMAPLRVLRVEKAPAGGFNVIAAWKAAEKLQPVGPLRQQFSQLGAVCQQSTPGGAEGSELVVHTAHPPVLCTGFEGSVAAAARHLFNLADASDEAKGCLAGAPLLSNVDESTKVPGVFLVGPSVRHGELSFCFIYKFRQRFGIVADAICRGLGRDTTEAVEECRKTNMFLDDFKCCKATCGEAC